MCPTTELQLQPYTFRYSLSKYLPGANENNANLLLSLITHVLVGKITIHTILGKKIKHLVLTGKVQVCCDKDAETLQWP